MSQYAGQYVTHYDLCLWTKTQCHLPGGELQSLPIPEEHWDTRMFCSSPVNSRPGTMVSLVEEGICLAHCPSRFVVECEDKPEELQSRTKAERTWLQLVHCALIHTVSYFG